MKYIMLKVTEPVEQLIPIIFPSNMVHSHIAHAIKCVLSLHHNLDSTVVSAGDITVLAHHVNGKSDTLKCTSVASDADVINSYDYTNGIV